MEVLDYLDLTVIDPQHVAEEVSAYIEKRKDMIDTLDTTVRVSLIKKRAGARTGAKEQMATLAKLMASDGKRGWKKGDYFFDFQELNFKWKDKAIHVSAGESVVLYQRLVRNQVTPAWAGFYANMKTRLGAGFLADVL